MRNVTLIDSAIVVLMTISAIPTMASQLKLSGPALRHRMLCVPPQQMENVCVAWAPGQPGQFAGPCIKSQLRCVSPTVLH
jgi:hypothetical protein